MGMTYTAEYMHVICCEAVAKQTMDYSVCVCVTTYKKSPYDLNTVATCCSHNTPRSLVWPY